MAASVESSREAQAAVVFAGLRLDDNGVQEIGEPDTVGIPRVISGKAATGTGVPGKGKQRARDQDAVCEGEEHPAFEEDEFAVREVQSGITMWCKKTEPSPITTIGKFFYAVHFDENCFLNGVTFDNCVFINVAFRGCMLRDAKFINIFLRWPWFRVQPQGER